MSQMPNPNPNSSRPARVGAIRFSAGLFLVALVLMCVVSPFVTQIHNGDMVEAVALTLVMATGVLAVGRSPGTLILGALLVAPAFVGKWINHLRPDLLSKPFYLVAALVFLLYVAGGLLRFVLRAPKVNSEVLCAVVSVYLLLAWIWTLAYNLVFQLAPTSFIFTAGPAGSQTMEGFTPLYFSFITLTTVGYGDIVPISNVARMLAMMEAVTGTLFVAVLVARMVALYSTTPPPEDKESGKNEPQ